MGWGFVVGCGGRAWAVWVERSGSEAGTRALPVPLLWVPRPLPPRAQAAAWGRGLTGR